VRAPVAAGCERLAGRGPRSRAFSSICEARTLVDHQGCELPAANDNHLQAVCDSHLSGISAPTVAARLSEESAIHLVARSSGRECRPGRFPTVHLHAHQIYPPGPGMALARVHVTVDVAHADSLPFGACLKCCCSCMVNNLATGARKQQLA
jgi:hypothetical protein